MRAVAQRDGADAPETKDAQAKLGLAVKDLGKAQKSGAGLTMNHHTIRSAKEKCMSDNMFMACSGRDTAPAAPARRDRVCGKR